MRISAIALTVVAFLGLTTTLHATTVLSENFDELTPFLSVSSVGAFTAINGTNVDIVGGTFYGNLCAGPETGNCIDMNGSSTPNPVGQLQSNMLFSPGTYDLSFDLIGSQRGVTSSTTVSFGSYDQTFNLASSDITTGIVSDAMVTLTSPGYLLFTSNDPNPSYDGNLLDNVVVSTTPEPSAIFLLGTGLLGVAGVMRKRFA